GFRVVQGMFYKGSDPGHPEVGDVRVRFEVTTPKAVSVIAVQRGSTFATYQAKAGSGILLLEEGEVGAPEMFEAAQAANAVTTWLVRLGGFVVMFVGLLLILRPISVLGSVVPLVGTVLGTGTGLLAFLVAVVLSLATIAFAWLAYRPLLGGFLLVLAAGGVILLIWSRRAHTQKVVPPPIPQP
ncbi:MAG TPA: TMEM43 family protein, partial [Vicinamibacterales bacterium]|nr:TMEM43 family protein [Vicinamibacterales bacterium]